MKGNRLAIPQSMRKEVLDRIHEGHQGITKCRARAQDSVWWPRISADIHERVSSCRECLERQPSQKKEPLLPSTPPERPFQRVRVDICEVKGDCYLVSTDYYSRYIDIAHLPRLTAHAVISKMKELFCSPWDSRDGRFGQRHTVYVSGIPAVCCQLKLPSHHVQFPFPPIQRAGREWREDGEGDHHPERPLYGPSLLSCHTHSLPWIQPSRAGAR